MSGQEDCCVSGIRTIVDTISAKRPYAGFVLLAMVNTATEIRNNDPDISIRNLSDQLAVVPHFEVRGEHKTFIWGPAAGRTDAEQAALEVATGISTSRVALAVAVCATRNCARYQQCLTKGEQNG